MVNAINHMEEVDSDLSPDDQVTLMHVFKDPSNAMAYLALKSDAVRKVWKKRELAEADSA